ncbi:enolase C-terminal domain-like protein [Streptomyces sp. CL12-4]|uniref:enolase C-terminal domain-like protein n=1 Tax=Streptomyces sp. CL12-4 TaxID=2810306 RepID=UPI0035ABCD67
MLRRGGVDILQPDVSVTGLGELVKVCHPGEAHDVAVVPHCSDGPVSPAASPQVSGVALNVPPHEQGLGLHCNTGCAGLPRGEMADYLLGPAPLVPVDGAVALPAGRAPASRATRRRCVPGTASGVTPMRGGAIRTGGSRSGDGPAGRAGHCPLIRRTTSWMSAATAATRSGVAWDLSSEELTAKG